MKKKLKPVPATELPEAVADMFESEDYVEYEYYSSDRIREKKKKTPKEEEMLADHDAEERRIRQDPEGIKREAHQAIDRGVSLLLKLIRAGLLARRIEPTPKGRAAGLKPVCWDDAFTALSTRISFLNRQLVRLAENNSPNACERLWFEATKLAEGFMRLALLFPEEFRPLAEKSLTMPSVRGANRHFSADAGAIIAAIHLAEKHPAKDLHDNRERVGALCHHLVAGLVDEIERTRQEFKREVESFERYQELEMHKNATLQEWLAAHYHPAKLEHIEKSAALPELPGNVPAWWAARVLPMVRSEFRCLLKNPKRNFALWQELKSGGERNTENDMRRYMEKICRNKLEQIAKLRP